jgi:hypothetical protein
MPERTAGSRSPRIGIARTPARTSEARVLDEPVSALAVSIRTGVLSLPDELLTERGPFRDRGSPLAAELLAYNLHGLLGNPDEGFGRTAVGLQPGWVG